MKKWSLYDFHYFVFPFFYLFIVYLMSLSIVQIIQCGISVTEY
jgi:hypothetical protein